jgi:acyl-[acyl-carrier-protein] desaturase
MIYVTLQELATRIAHRNTGKLIGDPAGYDVMMRVAADENLHHLFYRDLTSVAIEIDPSAAVIAMDEVVRTFAMPGTGIADFERHSARIAEAGIYDVLSHHEQILVPVLLRKWGVDKLEGLSDAAERAREAMLTFVERLGRLGRRLAARRQPAFASV